MDIGAASFLKGYLISQSKYIVYILDHARLTNTKTIDTPLKVNVQYSSFSGN